MIVFHITQRKEWENALEAGVYRADTLKEQGFIHCCFAQQRSEVLQQFFQNQDDLVILTLDSEKLVSEVRLENLEGGLELFPHIYGEINLDAVTACKEAGMATQAKRIEILPAEFILKPYHQWEQNWLLLTAGDFVVGKFNAMTVAWGSFGCLWNKPFAQIFVRPTRYTHSLTEEYPTFSLCAFSSEYHKALNMLGTISGRESKKMRDCGLTPIAANQIDAPVYEEAELVIECTRMYRDILKPEGFLDLSIEAHYSKKDYHQIYYGEIVHIEGSSRFLQKI